MADTDKTVAYGVSADASAFEQGMQKAASSAKNAASEIDSQFKKVSDVFGGVQKALLGITAVIAGGGAFKALINQAAEWNGEAGKISKALGISTEKASILNVALNHLGLDSETYISASQKMSKQIFSNSAAFETLGVKVRDTTTNAYRPVTDIMGEVNKKLMEIKNPIEQNIAGLQVYGKSWQEVKGIIRLNVDEMERAETRARQLGLIVGPEGVAATKQYKEQMRDLSLVSKSLSVQFGNELLPIFTKTGAFMAEEGPAAGKVFATILESIAFAASSAWLALKDMGDGAGALAAQTAALLSGDLAGLKAIGKARDDEAAKNEAAYERLKKNFGAPLPAAPAAKHQDEGPQYQFKPEKEAHEKAEKPRTSEWEAALAEKKAAVARESMEEGVLREYSKAEELKYWQAIGAKANLTTTERAAVGKKAAEVEISMVRDTFESKVRVLEAEAASYKSNTDKRLDLERQVQAKYAEGTKGYEESQKRINAIMLEAAAQQKQIGLANAQNARDVALAEIAVYEQAAQLDYQLGITSQQDLLALQANFETQKSAIQREALADRLRIAELDPDKNIVEVNRIHLEVEQAERQHQARMAEIKNALAREKAAPAMGGANAIQTALEQSTATLLTNSKNTQQALANIWKQSYSSFMSEMITKPMAALVMRKIKETALFQSMFGIQISGQAAASGAVMGTKTAETAVVGGANATQAGTGAFAALAAIPIIGPALAAVAGPAMFALVMAMVSRGASHSAAGGFDIPSTINPLTQLHAREMVLPAKHADVIRSLSEGGRGGGGGSVVMNITTPNADSFRRSQTQIERAQNEAQRRSRS